MIHLDFNPVYKGVKKARVVLLIIACIAFVIGLPFSIEAKKASTHNPDDISIEMIKTTREETTQEYHVFVTFKVTNHTISTIKQLQFVTDVYKNGNDLGYFLVETGSIQIAPESSSELTVRLTVQKNSWDTPTDLFVELYNNGLQNVHGSFSIYGVKWTDSESYWEPSKQRY